MSTRDRVDELLAGFALGALSAEEARIVHDHLPGCPKCAATLAELAVAAAVLPLSVEEIEPPASLRARVLAAAREPAGHDVAPEQSVVVPLRRSWISRPQLYPWAAAAVVLLALGSWNLNLQAQISRTNSQVAQQQVVHANLADSQAASVGSVAYLSGDHLALVQLHALAAPPSGRAYELWVIDAGGKADPAGVFLPEPDGTKLLVVSRSLSPTDRLAVTVEPAAGSRQPTTAPIITGKI